MRFNPNLETQIVSGQISQLIKNPLVNLYTQNPSSL